VQGLAVAVRSLARRAPIPVTVITVDDTQRWNPLIESAAYYVVAEALTNVLKYSGATAATIRVLTRDERLMVEVTDDGRGGAHRHGLGPRWAEDRSKRSTARSVDSPTGRAPACERCLTVEPWLPTGQARPVGSPPSSVALRVAGFGV
jgi:hypothetical protein